MFLGLETAAHNNSIPTFNSLDLINVPYSHSLGMSVIWSCLLGVVVGYLGRSTKAGCVVALVVFSHWILDYITHIPDLPLWFGTTKVGLGLWKSAWATFILETILFGSGIFLYLKNRGPASQKQKLIYWSLISFMFIIYLLHVFGPKPPETNSPSLVAGPAFAIWLLVLWAYYADKRAS